MRIAIIGQQAFGKSVLEAFLARGDTVAGVFCAPEKAGAKPDPLRVAAGEHGLRLLQLPSLKTTAALEAMRSLDVDLAVMAYVLQYAPQAFVNIPRHGTIQYHPSLLPQYRGPSAINWPIIKGDRQTGLTIFRPTDGLDEGPIILQKTVAIGSDNTLGSIYFQQLFPLGVDAMLEAADRVMAGQHSETMQDETSASYEGWCRDAAAAINWHAHIDQIHNLIRGCDPAPGAWTGVNGVHLRLYHASKQPIRRFADIAGKPGEILAFDSHDMHVAAQGGTLTIGKARADKGEKMPAAALAEAMGLHVGDRLDAVAPTAPTAGRPLWQPWRQQLASGAGSQA